MSINETYWFEHELRQYPATGLDLATLREHSDRILLAAGRDSRGYPCHEAGIELGKMLDRRVTEMPGGHLGFATKPADFASALVTCLTDAS
jgi:hypothetical protein